MSGAGLSPGGECEWDLLDADRGKKSLAQSMEKRKKLKKSTHRGMEIEFIAKSDQFLVKTAWNRQLFLERNVLSKAPHRGKYEF